MEEKKSSILKGKKGLIVGIANERSLAWGIANCIHQHGGELADISCLQAWVPRLEKMALIADAPSPCIVRHFYLPYNQNWGDNSCTCS